MTASLRILRCAIYTRVSTDAGLEQDFNSLDAQREACEAYVRSQSREGWKLVPTAFDDGGFSGGSLERPALQRLLDAVRAGRVETIVVYKVDRLTRSLADFAKLVELFDAHGASFVSVTQSFNTTTSMGRLTLNVLLSFAQFEREVTGERIRDKIAASKKKGLWMGGVVPLGYRVEARRLVADEEEAALVRRIFERYLALGSLPALQRELREQGIVTRRRVAPDGRAQGGVPLTNGPLAHILKNRVYLGEINHRDASYPGEHDPIVPKDLFDAVADHLAANRVRRSNTNAQPTSPLKGRLRDDRGHPMSPSFAVKTGVRYRYYVSQALVQGRKGEAGSLARVSALAIEEAVADAIRPLLNRNAAAPHDPSDDPAALIEACVSSVTVSRDELRISLSDALALAEFPNPLIVPWRAPSTTRRRQIIGEITNGAQPRHDPRPIRAEARDALLRGIALGRLWLDELISDPTSSVEAIALRDQRSARSVRSHLSLAFLAPAIVQAAIDGALPRGLGLARMFDAPMAWGDQRKALGLG